MTMMIIMSDRLLLATPIIFMKFKEGFSTIPTIQSSEIWSYLGVDLIKIDLPTLTW